jgi:hypothetical protein
MMIGTRHRRHRSNHWCSFGMFGAPRCSGSRPGGLGSPAKGGVERYGMQGGNTQLVVLGDLDGDGDLDAFSTGRGFGEIWFNQGGAQGGTDGVFEHSQHFSYSIWFASTLGDVDGDGDLDVFTGLLEQATRVWLNDGTGRFVEKR